MPIIVDCSGCLRRLRLPETAAGGQGKCPRCGSTFVIPDMTEDLPSFTPVEFDEYAPIGLADALSRTTEPPPSADRPVSSGLTEGRSGGSGHARRVDDLDMPFVSMISLAFRWTIAALIAWSAIAAAVFLIGLVVGLLLTLVGMNPVGPRR